MYEGKLPIILLVFPPNFFFGACLLRNSFFCVTLTVAALVFVQIVAQLLKNISALTLLVLPPRKTVVLLQSRPRNQLTQIVLHR